MAEVVRLEEGQDPPPNKDWVLVQQRPSGTFDGNGSVIHSRGATFYASSPADLKTTIEEAKDWAERHGVPTVYLREP